MRNVVSAASPHSQVLLRGTFISFTDSGGRTLRTVHEVASPFRVHCTHICGSFFRPRIKIFGKLHNAQEHYRATSNISDYCGRKQNHSINLLVAYFLIMMAKNHVIISVALLRTYQCSWKHRTAKLRYEVTLCRKRK